MKRNKILSFVLSLMMVLSLIQLTGNDVMAKKAKIKLSSTKVTLRVGQSKKLVLKNAKSSKVKWQTSNKKIATVKKGVVKAKKKGKATITATCKKKKYKCKITVKKAIKVKKIKLNVSKLTLMNVRGYQLKVTFTPKNTTNKKVTYASSNKKVATVSKKGYVKAVKNGTATITAKSGGKKATCKVTVKSPGVKVIKVTLSKTKLTLTKGKTYTIKATVYPSNATNKKVTYSSSKKSVATVTSAGKIKAVKKGTATITAKAGSKKATCKVTVKNASVACKSIAFTTKKLSLKVGSKANLKVTFNPSNTSNKKLTYTSTNKNVASVTSGGKVTAVKAGSATIIARTSNNKKAECAVTVTADKKTKTYTYTITPIVSGLNSYYYVKTTDPDISNVVFKDNKTVYTTGDHLLKMDTTAYSDVKYVNASKHQVKDGYIFSGSGVDGDVMNILKVSKDSSGKETYTDTTYTVTIPQVKDAADDLIDRYGRGTTDFNTRFSNIKKGLDDERINALAVYDSTKASATPYPYYTIKDGKLIAKYDMYAKADVNMLALKIDPYILTASEANDLLTTIAKRLDANVSIVKSTDNKTVTINKVSYDLYQDEDPDPVFTTQVTQNLIFDNSATDLYKNMSLTSLRSYFVNLKTNGATIKNNLISSYKSSMILNKEGWIRLYTSDANKPVYSYVVKNETNEYVPLTNTFIDGRYINKEGVYEAGALHKDHLDADIIVNKTYKNYLNKEVTKAIKYTYNSKTKKYTTSDDYFYYNNGSYLKANERTNYPLPSDYTNELKLPDDTDDQLTDAIRVDTQTNVLPEKGLIYDGLSKAGSKFTNKTA